MPRPKKPAGQAVDKRNGSRLEISKTRLEPFMLPERKAPWHEETVLAWDALWADEPLVAVMTMADRPVLLRWADSMDRYLRFLAQGDDDPIARGSQGQPVESPAYGIADKALRVTRECESQLGIGALHRARLGIAIVSEQRGLAELNAAYSRSEPDDDDTDPRVIPGRAE